MTQRRTTKKLDTIADVKRRGRIRRGKPRKVPADVVERERFLKDLASIPGVTVRRY